MAWLSSVLNSIGDVASQEDPNMNDENGEAFDTQFIPDFFREVISRIIPGLVVVALYLYWSDGDFTVVSSSFTRSAFFVIVAWIVGIILDVPLYVGYELLRFVAIKLLKINEWRITKWIVRLWSRIPVLKNLKAPSRQEDDWPVLCRATSWERGAIIKAMALTVFYRNMCVIGGLTAIVCSDLRFSSALPTLFEDQSLYLILGLFFCFVFAGCWYSNREGVNRHLRRITEDAKERARRTVIAK